MNLKMSAFFFALVFLLGSCEKNDGKDIGDMLTPEYSAFLVLMNDLRASGCNCGEKAMSPVPPVKWNDTLAMAALQHSRDMKTENLFNHIGSDGSNAGERIKRTGYVWATYGENIAWGYPGIEDVFQGWINSPGHCENMMEKDFKEIGLSREGNYWTLDLATRK